MSNIYIQEPPTSGKVLLTTSVGDIDIELWSKEAPKACRNFAQLCMEGYYDGTIFHRVVKGFIVQGGDPTGTGEGGESIWGKPFKDELHSRLRFTRRGLVAMANAGPHDNGSQFFFTMGEARELNNKHTIFGKVAGDTIYNMIKLEEIETDHNERPLYPHKIIRTKVLSNPFDDIIPRQLPKRKDQTSSEGKKKKSKSKATKNFKLLSFGEEAEEDEEEVNEVTKTMRGKGKSSHDLLDDEKLSHVPAVEASELKRKHDSSESETEEQKEEKMDALRKKLKKTPQEPKRGENDSKEEEMSDDGKKESKLEELKKESRRLKRELLESRKQKDEKQKETNDSGEESEEESNELLADFKAQRKKYSKQQKLIGKKGSDREAATLDMLAKFQAKMRTTRQMSEYDDDEEKTEKKKTEDGEVQGDTESDEDDYIGLNWMKGGKLEFEEHNRKVMDANVQELDRYEIFDPRNPLNKRRREESKQQMKKGSKR